MHMSDIMNLRGRSKRSVTAKELGITPQFLGAIERGDRKPSRELTIKMASYYGVSIDQFIFFINKETKRVSNDKGHVDASY